MHDFYTRIIYEDKTVHNSRFWLPLPYWHSLRDEALRKFIDFGAIPWVDNDPALPYIWPMLVAD